MLPEVYSPFEVPRSSDPETYLSLFEDFLHRPEERNQAAYLAMTRSYDAGYDLFHRLEPIVESAIFTLKNL
jgi:hypothetical protein